MSLQDIETRFKGVENSAPPTPDQQSAVADIRKATLELAHIIDTRTTNPRYRATALTELETAAMFAVKGVFQPETAR